MPEEGALMGDVEATTNSDNQAATAGDDKSGWSWKARLILLAVAVGGAVVAWIVAVAVVPRWWAERLSTVVDGRMTMGTIVGLGLGVVFTLLPILFLRIGWRFRGGWKRSLVGLVVALLFALPNLMTLGIVVGTGSGAHAAERNLDVDAPGIRMGSLIGAIIGALLGLGLIFLAWSRKRNKVKAKELATAAKTAGASTTAAESSDD